MSNLTQYKSLTKPLSVELYDVEVFNNNADIIDTELHNLEVKNEEQDNNLSDIQDDLNSHKDNTNNPHEVKASQIGLGKVENKSSEDIRNEITTDNVINALGYIPYTPEEIDNKLSGLGISDEYIKSICGEYNTTSGVRSVTIGGQYNTASGFDSVILGGIGNQALDYQVILGHYNDISLCTANESDSGGGNGTALCIGNGARATSSNNYSPYKSNALRADYNGKLWCKSSYSSTGADYAELFEWQDGNHNNDIRYGYFVTMVGNKIKKANPGDWILGIVSANPCILGNSDMEWQGQFLKDEFGAYIIEDTTTIEIMRKPKLDEDGNQVYEEVPLTDTDGNPLFNKKGKPVYVKQPIFEEVAVKVPCQAYKLNSDYNPDQAYIDRLSRPEWDAIGMIGVLSVYDDGTCKEDGFCTVADGGIATASTYGYRVIERVTDNIVKVVINAESSNMIFTLMNKIEELECKFNNIL